MRRRLLRFAGLGVAAHALLSGCADGSGTPQESARLRQLLEERWRDRYGTKTGGFTMMLIGPGGEAFASTQPGVGASSHFRGASTTKTFTSAAIMLLDERGLLRIDDGVASDIPGTRKPYLPATPDFDVPHRSAITIRQLLQHRAGMFDLVNNAVPADAVAAPAYAGRNYVEWQLERDAHHSFAKDELIAVVASNRLARSAPGQSYGYADMHFTVLGRIVEEVTGETLNAFIGRELLAPNGLAETRFVVDGHETTLPAPYIPAALLYQGTVIPRDDYNFSYDPGSGNVCTTPAELVRWVRRLVRGEAGIRASQVARMLDPGPNARYGLGLEHKVGADYDLGWGHNGTNVAFNTDVFHDPTSDVSYVLVCSLVDADDMAGQDAWMAQTAIAARRLQLV